MRARHLAVCVTVLTLVFAACNGDGGGNESSSRSRSGTTTDAPRIPEARTEVAGAFWDGKIAVAGGLTPDSSTDRLDLFDVSSRTWSPGPQLPHRYDHASLTELGGRLYLVGGYLSQLSNPTSEVWSLGPGEDSWTQEPSLATRRGAPATAAANGRLVTVGGVDGSGTVLRTTEIFTPGSGWSAGPNMSIPREHLGAAGAGDKVYAIAGRNANGAVTSVESLVVGDGEWRSEPAVHDERSGMGGATSESGRICTGGGEVPGRPTTVPTIECLDEGAWERVGRMRVPRHGVAVVAVGNRIHFVAGGPEPGGSFSDAHEVLEV
jgi:hypothetical protein